MDKFNIANKKLLIVGAGGIGCEILKNVLLMGFKDIEIVDLDVIDLSNLNRQFLFSKEHIGLSKAIVASKVSIERYANDANIKPHHCEIQNSTFDVDYYKQFAVVINALDNLAARKHVNRMCVNSGVPLIDGGTAGFIGQTTPIIPKQTECYECVPKAAPKGYAVCTIRTNPTKPIHCVFWSKQLLQKLFGNSDDGNFLSDLQFDKHEDYSQSVFDRVFTSDIEVLRNVDDLWLLRKKPNVWTYQEMLQKNETTHEKYLSIAQNAELFKTTFNSLYKRRQESGVFEFDKDDDTMIDFIMACTNIRCYIFNLQPLERFDIQQKAGDIIPAIPTTNAIISGLMVIELMKVINEQYDDIRTVYLSKIPSRNKVLQFEKVSKPSNSCYICSNEMIEFECNIMNTTLRSLMDDITEKCSLLNPCIATGNQMLYESGDDLDDFEINVYNANSQKNTS
ncbi:SUMO-activating enzyme subunit [Entamoeba marina]